MDDFGTGYSSLNYLRRFPFDKVKIDKSFIENMAQDASSLAIVQAVISIAKSRDIATTAEGVEKQEQLELLRALGCTEMQGYLFSTAEARGGTCADAVAAAAGAAAAEALGRLSCYPRPTNGMPFAITVMNSTLVSSGRLAI